MRKLSLILTILLVNSFSAQAGLPAQNGIDTYSQSPVVVQHDRKHIHEGNHYYVKTWLINTGATATFNEFIFITPSGNLDVHAKVKVAPDADLTVEIFEGATVSANGTPVPGLNNNRQSSNTSGLLPYAAPTVTSDGALIWAARNGGGRNAVGVSNSLNYEIVVKRGTIYLFRLTKNTTADTIIDIDFWWSEHAPTAAGVL